MWSRPILCAVLALVAGIAADARADPSPRSRSIGTPEHGRLVGGVRLRESAHVRRVRYYTARGHVYGTPELVGLISRAAARVAQRHPGAKLGVGELSRRRGGDIEGHAGHESGREADLAFYLLDSNGRPAEPERYATLRGDGTAEPPFETLRLDEARTWALIEALVSDAEVTVDLIYVGAEIRDRLLIAGRAAGAAPAVVERAAATMRQPPTGHAHRNHLHVRIACPPDDRPACRG